jgi:hypothetical protein
MITLSLMLRSEHLRASKHNIDQPFEAAARHLRVRIIE